MSSSAAPYHPHCTDGWQILPPVSCCLDPILQPDDRCRELEPKALLNTSMKYEFLKPTLTLALSLGRG